MMALPESNKHVGRSNNKAAPAREAAIREFVAASAAEGSSSQVIADDVAARFGIRYDASTIRRYRKQELDAARDRLAEAADAALLRQVEDVHDALNAIAPKVQAGNLLAIDRMVKLLEREAKLLGLDGRLGKRESGGGGPVVISLVGV